MFVVPVAGTCKFPSPVGCVYFVSADVTIRFPSASVVTDVEPAPLIAMSVVFVSLPVNLIFAVPFAELFAATPREYVVLLSVVL